jgi:hypothetical protein
LFKLLERDVCGRGKNVEVQTVRVCVFLKFWGGELLFAMVEFGAPVGGDALCILADHGMRCCGGGGNG